MTSSSAWVSEDGDTASELLAEFLGLVDDFDFDIKAVYADREFYDGKCLTLLQAHNYTYIMPTVKWGTKIQTELSEGWSREIEHDLTTGSPGRYRPGTSDFPVATLSSSAAISCRLDTSHQLLSAR